MATNQKIETPEKRSHEILESLRQQSREIDGPRSGYYRMVGAVGVRKAHSRHSDDIRYGSHKGRSVALDMIKEGRELAQASEARNKALADIAMKERYEPPAELMEELWEELGYKPGDTVRVKAADELAIYDDHHNFLGNRSPRRFNPESGRDNIHYRVGDLFVNYDEGVSGIELNRLDPGRYAFSTFVVDVETLKVSDVQHQST